MSLTPDPTTLPDVSERQASPAGRPNLRKRLSGDHTAFSATLLLMTSSLLSGLLGLVRTKYIAHVFVTGPETDAYNAAFQLPDMLAYFLVGGVASISLVTILNRYAHAGDEEGGDRALSIVLNAMVVVLSMAIIIAEFAAPLYTHYFFPGFVPPVAALCTSLTRILLPAQLFFFIGGVLGSKLLARRIFLYQALQPLVYNLGIILGAVFLSARFGIYSLAIGAMAGVIAGPAALNAFGAYRNGLRYKPILSLRHPAFLEWLRLTVPLMIGVSLVTADKWILSHFASADSGAITRLTYAKTLFNAPIGILGQAAGAASLPFFSALFAQDRLTGFAAAVNRAASRILAVSLLAGAWMIALASPIVDLFRGGSFSRADAHATAAYFVIFSFSIALWTVQGIYARAFYAARDTRTPAVAGWIVTLATIPVYKLLFAHFGVIGLAFASDIGIAVQTLTLAILLHTRGLVFVWRPAGRSDATGLEWAEIARAMAAAAAGFAGAAGCVRLIRVPTSHIGDLTLLISGTLAWLILCWAVLAATGSALPRQIMRRK
jgi:putative peptidoglycan lipid II flippase